VKKIFLSILTMMYMTVSSGIAMEIHYCMGEKAGVDFYQLSDEKCGKCGMKEQNKKGCCSDEHQFYKLEDSHKKAVADYSFQIGEIAIVHTYPTFDWQVATNASTAQPVGHSPPDYLQPPARILHGVFRL
jgi:hypothetical protein